MPEISRISFPPRGGVMWRNTFCNQEKKQFCSETSFLSNRRHQGEFCATVISLLYFVLFHLPSRKQVFKWLILVIRIMQTGAFPSLQCGKFIIFSGASLIDTKRETGPMAELRWETTAGLGSGGFVAWIPPSGIGRERYWWACLSGWFSFFFFPPFFK